jgi:hypothetical protein
MASLILGTWQISAQQAGAGDLRRMIGPTLNVRVLHERARIYTQVPMHHAKTPSSSRYHVVYIQTVTARA